MTCGAQETDGDVDSQIEALRADFRADKTQLVTDAMRFTAEESKIFWPIYRKYDADLTSINDQRVALIKDYASKYASMTDADAKALLDKALNFEAERAKLKKEYAKKFEEAGLSGLTTAKFFQLEHRLDALVDVKLASELPSLLVQKQAK
jgi:predicted GH43/DUF377 family glycosyl hydrolase